MTCAIVAYKQLGNARPHGTIDSWPGQVDIPTKTDKLYSGNEEVISFENTSHVTPRYLWKESSFMHCVFAFAVSRDINSPMYSSVIRHLRQLLE